MSEFLHTVGEFARHGAIYGGVAGVGLGTAAGFFGTVLVELGSGFIGAMLGGNGPDRKEPNLWLSTLQGAIVGGLALAAVGTAGGAAVGAVVYGIEEAARDNAAAITAPVLAEAPALANAPRQLAKLDA